VTKRKCHVTSNKAKSNLECAEENLQTRGRVRYTFGFSIGRTSVKKLLPPQAMRGILLGMRGLVRSYVTLHLLTRSQRCFGHSISLDNLMAARESNSVGLSDKTLSELSPLRYQEQVK
jgi:hypothetical protein